MSTDTQPAAGKPQRSDAKATMQSNRFHSVTRRQGALALLACGLAAGAGKSWAQGPRWPARPITFVVPFAPGTATDVLARTIADSIAKSLNTAVAVENRAGASAAIGASAVARAAPDGYTILFGSSSTHAANAALFNKLSYDPIKDFAPITLLGEIPQVMVVNANIAARNVSEFIAYAKAEKGKVAYAQGSSGNHVPAAILDRRNDLGMTMVAYRSPPPALVDVLGGVVPMMFADMSVSLTNIRGGRLRALAVTSRTRSPLLPDVPTLAETMPGFELTSWIAMWAPANTPAPIVAQLGRAAHAGLKDKAIRDKLQATGFSILMSTPAELGLLVAKETIKWAKLVNEAGIERQ